MQKKVFILALFFGFWVVQLNAQNLFALRTAKDAKGNITFYAQNKNYCPYQCEIDIYDKEYFSVNAILPYYFIIPPQTDSLFLFVVKPLNSNMPDVVYRYDYDIGNPENSPDNYTYLLPYQHATSQFVSQGYYGKFSHKDTYAIDFKMKQGTPICASRAGVVIAMRKDSNFGGKTSQYSADANYIRIYHEDGTYANYLHLAQDGSEVVVGDKVEAGQVIGYSGNTGWSTMPHLHFEIRKPIYLGYASIPTKFYTKKGRQKRIKAWRSYAAFHPAKKETKNTKIPRKNFPPRQSK